MRNLLVIYSLCILVLSGCGRDKAGSGITVAGSTSVQPFADKWAEVYMEENPGKIVNVQGGGSSAGIQATKSGACNIGTSSRDLKSDEKDLTEIVVARDGLAIIVHPLNPIDNLGLEQVKGIFNGKIRNWRELGGSDKMITVVTREEGSGTRGAFQELVMKKDRVAKSAIVQDSNGTVREIVAGDPNSIGYISLGLVNNKVRALKLNGVPATDENIISKKYKLVRPFLFVTKGEPTPVCREFINFVQSAEGQKLVSEEGLIPVK
ncbi:MAG: phosphate ABC transporter substrate-binding protein [bacterium]|nr:phosphate ABC transporter substrate-binding protein [bacterium]MDD5353651.1 phosphate ABC transporter substrate-binding protein [bacterium]MDD5756482.1 phosphate ABC transporter substrate-binding protein [bacterium]